MQILEKTESSKEYFHFDFGESFLVSNRTRSGPKANSIAPLGPSGTYDPNFTEQLLQSNCLTFEDLKLSFLSTLISTFFSDLNVSTNSFLIVKRTSPSSRQ